ncbi:mediator of RNA polymerase II transcription subunit 29-like [Styela clava]
MYSQTPDGRQQVQPGMHVMHTMPQLPVQIPSHSQQINPGMQGGNMAMQGIQRPSLGSINPSQPSLNAPGVGTQMTIGGIRQPVNVVGQQIVVKSEIGVSVPSQRMPAPSQPNQPQESQGGNSQPATHDRILKFKQLLPQLKECLVNLISVARQNFAANATIDNLEKSVDTSLLPRFDKALEQFYAICNQIEANLCLANDQIAQTIFSMQYTPLTASQMKDNSNMQVYTNYINTVKQQLNYAKDIQNMLTETSNRILSQSQSNTPINTRPF